jgi:hypothetical protein
LNRRPSKKRHTVNIPGRQLHLRQDTKQILYVVAHLVRDHASMGELAALASDIAAAEAPRDPESRDRPSDRSERTLSTPVRFTESCGPRLLLGAEPTIRLYRANITATSFHVVDTAVAHDFGTQSNLSFD